MNDQPILTGPSISAPATLYVLWVGDAALGQRFTARRAPHVQIVSQSAGAAVELLQGRGDRIPDLLVIDATMPGVEPLQLLRLAGSDPVDLPVVLLTQPGQDDLIAQAEGLAVCDAVVKTPDFVHQLLPAFAQVRARHDVLAVLRTTRQSEERFRTILELQPAVTCLVGPDGTILAMNQAGIGLLAASREQVVGRAFTSLLPPDEQEQAQDFIARVCGGDAGILEHAVIKADGTMARVRTEAVSLPRAEGNVALATLHERFESSTAPDPSIIDGLMAERDRLLEQLREAADQVDALRADLDADRAEWTEETRAADTRHLTALQELDAERGRLDRALRDAAEQAAAVHRDAEHEREQLAQALQGATIRCEGLAADFYRAEGAVRDAQARQQRDANTIKSLEAERERLRGELEHAQQNGVSTAAETAWNSERETWNAERDSWTSERATFTAERGGWTDERTTWEQKAQQSQAEHAALVDAISLERDRAITSLQNASARCETLTDQLQHAEQQRREGEGQIDAKARQLETELQEAIARAQHADARAQESDQRAQHAEARAHESDQRVRQADERAERAENAARELEAAAQTQNGGAARLLDEEREQHTRAIQDLRLQHDTVAMERERVGQSLRSATTRCEQLSDQLQRAEAALRDAESSRDAYRAAETKWDAERSQWTSELRQFEAEQAQVRAERDALLERLQQAEAAARDLAADRAQIGDTAKQLQDERDRHAQLLHTLRADHKSADLRWTEERAQWVERAQQSHDTHMSVVDAIAAERDQLVKKLKSATTRCEALEDAIRHSDSGAKESMGRHAQDADTIHLLNADIRAFAAQRDRLTRELDDTRAHHAALEQAWGLERARWQESNTQAAAEQQARLEALQQTVDALHLQRQELKNALAQATNRIESLAAEQHQSRAVEAAAETQKLARELHDTEARCEHLVGEMSRTRAALGQAEAQLAAQAAEVAEARRRVAALDLVDQRILADQQDLAALRQELLRFLCDADIRVKSLSERRDATRHTLDDVRQP